MPKRFTTIDTQQAKKTLARRFIPLADSLRDMLTKFGLRTYKVSFVRVRWSGTMRGEGTPTVELHEPLLPTPKIGGVDSLSKVAQPVGLDELGSMELTQISGRYTEDQLMGLAPDGRELDPQVEFFYEVEFFPQTEGPSVKRRFYPTAPPMYHAGGLKWSIRLEKSHVDRNRNGDVGW